MMLEASGEDFALVGDAADGASVLQVVKESQPDVVLMDIRMPGMDGLEALEHLREHWPQIAVIILTTYNEDELLIRGLRAGARGYLLKDTSRETLFQAIRVAARGEMLVQPEVMARVLSHAPSRDVPPQFARSGGLACLSRHSSL
jgi:NarL family two-component system response regulator YdfI